MYGQFSNCWSNLRLSEYKNCSDNHTLGALEEHSGYIASVLDGYDPVVCQSM